MLILCGCVADGRCEKGRDRGDRHYCLACSIHPSWAANVSAPSRGVNNPKTLQAARPPCSIAFPGRLCGTGHGIFARTGKEYTVPGRVEDGTTRHFHARRVASRLPPLIAAS